MMTTLFRNGNGGEPALALSWYTDANDPDDVSDFVANNNGIALVSDGTYLYAMLGRRTGEDFSNDVYRLEIGNASGGWVDLADPFTSPVAHGVAHHHSGLIYYLGGYNNGFASRRTAIMEYTIGNGAWRTTTDVLGVSWAGMTSVVGDNNQLYFGGGDAGAPTNRFSKFNPNAAEGSRVTNLANYPVNVQGLAMAYDGGNFIYGAGGHDGSSIRSGLRRYSISGNSWVQLASMPAARSEGALLYHDSKLYYIHGTNTRATYNGTTLVASVYEYDTVTDQWTTLDASFDAPIPRAIQSSYRQVGNVGYILGGIGSAGSMTAFMDAFGIPA